MNRKIALIICNSLACAAFGFGLGFTVGHQPRVTPDVVTVHDGEPTGDLTPPTRLDIIMPLNDDKIAECYDMGGIPYPNHTIDTLTCMGVDY